MYAFYGLPGDQPPPSWADQGALLAAEDLAEARRSVQQCVDTGDPFCIDFRIRSKDGVVRPCRVKGAAAPGQDGKPVHLFGSMEDLTVVHQLRADLDTARRDIRKVLEETTDGYLETDHGFVLTYVNARARRLLRLGQEALGRSLWQNFSEARETPYFHYYKEAIDHGEPRAFEEYYPPLDRWFSVHACPSSDRLAIYFQDITERKKALGALEAATRRLEAAQRIAAFGDWEWDLEDDRLDWSAEVFRLLDIDPHGPSPTLRTILALFHREDVKHNWAAVRRAIRRGDRFDLRFRRPRADGTVQHLRIKGRGTVDASGRPERLVGSLADITQDVEQEEALIRAKEEAEKANRAKALFLAKMNHELRNPLNSIIGPAEVILAQGKDPSIRHLVTMILTSGEHLLDLINRLLTLSRLQSDSFDLDVQAMPVQRIFQEVVDMFRLSITQKGVRLETNISPDVPDEIRFDPAVFRQIFVNLMSNANKFTSQGRIRTALERNPAGDGWLLTVEDTGPGIPAEDSERIFQAFQQHEALRMETTDGAGLGLAISHELADLCGGALTFSSVVGQGSSFRFAFGEIEPDPQATRRGAYSALGDARPQA